MIENLNYILCIFNYNKKPKNIFTIKRVYNKISNRINIICNSIIMEETNEKGIKFKNYINCINNNNYYITNTSRNKHLK